jgi:hypothetical protein
MRAEDDATGGGGGVGGGLDRDRGERARCGGQGRDRVIGDAVGDLNEQPWRVTQRVDGEGGLLRDAIKSCVVSGEGVSSKSCLTRLRESA